MSRSILLVSPNDDFIDLIRQSLEETGRYLVYNLTNPQSAISCLENHEDCTDAILDLEIGDEPLLELGLTLRRINPSIGLIIISREDKLQDFDELRPWKLLRKPLLFANLLYVLCDETSEEKKSSSIIDVIPQEVEQEKLNLLLNDATTATQRLTHLTTSTTVQEALISREDKLWVYAGQLPKQAVDELNLIVASHSKNKEKSDLFRYVKLETTQTEHTLYTTYILASVILALVFDEKIQFKMIRRQTESLVNLLSLPEIEYQQALALPMGHESEVLHREQMEEMDVFHESDLQDVNTSQFPRQEYQPYPNNLHSNIAPVLKHVGLYETSIRKTTEELQQPLLASTSPSLCDTTYTCLLLPRFNSHQLTDMLADLMPEWFSNICTAFGWRLEYLDIHPDYIQWVANLPPTLAPAKHITIVRRETSKLIFEGFPIFKRENLSGDFWSPGFMLTCGTHLHSLQQIKDFIQQNRQRYRVD